MGQDSLIEIGIDSPIPVEANSLARLARENGIDGVVCSPAGSAGAMRSVVGEEESSSRPVCALPAPPLAIRRASPTPSSAFKAGSSHIVVGRPITGAENPVDAYEAIIAELCAMDD